MNFNSRIRAELCLAMQHKGEIVEKAVRESGYPITRLAQKIGKSRRWMYIAFENPDLSIDIILQIGKVIQHDFANEIKQIRNFEREILSANVNEPNETFHGNRNAEFWKNKYLSLLEKYNQLLESKTSSSTKKYPVRKKNK